MSVNDAPNGAGDSPQGFGTPPPPDPQYQGQQYPGQQFGQPYPGQPGPGQPSPAPPYGQAYPGYGAPLPPSGRPPTYLAWAITVTVGGVLFSLILGFPTGLVATRYARNVRNAWNAGDAQGAVKASRRALTWSIVSTCLDVLGLILLFVVLSQPTTTTG